MKSKSSLLILIVVILAIVGISIYFFAIKGDATTPSKNATGLVSTNTGSSAGVVAISTTESATGSQVVSLLRNLSAIQLSDAVFRNPAFSLLSDISIALPPVTNQGRRNPFAPVGVDTVIVPQADTTTVDGPSF